MKKPAAAARQAFRLSSLGEAINKLHGLDVDGAAACASDPASCD